MKQILPLLLTVCVAAHADTINVNTMRHYGPVAVNTPMVLGDTTKLKAKPLDASMALTPANARAVAIDGVAPGTDGRAALNVLEFDFENRRYAEASLDVKGLTQSEVLVDGKATSGKLKLHPGTHTATIRYISQPNVTDSLSVTLATDADGLLRLVDDGTRMMTLDDMMFGTRITSVAVSPSGAYMLADYADTDASGRTRYWQQLYDLRTGRPMYRMAETARWMPDTDKYYTIRQEYATGRSLVVTDPATQTEVVLAENLPDGQFVVSPTGDYLVFTLERKGEAEDVDAYQVLEPEDRLPGWRNRQYAAIYRLDGSGAFMPLSTGSETSYVTDITADGSKLLLMTMKSRLQRRPTTVNSLLLVDAKTLRADTLLCEAEFISSAEFSPDGHRLLIAGTPEAFDRIGCVVPDSVYPSMIQTELFVMDIDSRDIMPITRDFDPNPQEWVWSQADGKIYTRAEKRDMYGIYSYDTRTGRWTEVQLPEELPKRYDIAPHRPMMGWVGQSSDSPDALYCTDLRSGRTTLLDTPSAKRLEHVRRSAMADWNFVNQRGDTIYGRYYLPDNFDPERKYPMIVYYYGGCSPSTRTFESRYPMHVYSQLGYVVYVVQPSGATGFGQEFSSRHVNTAGDGPAQDIIEGTKLFLDEHPYVDRDKVGCIGASYGGFMTQYLQTITDIFAAAVSHAGISDHTSYWGEGYWGYSYSETSMANSYPWTSEELYVRHSPLYNADKVNTPILFLHGDVDTNVPVGESIQMFTALKLLQKETAMVLIEGENHHINDYDKRRKWQDTIFAWLAKYLQDDPSWWNEMYPARGL